MGVFKDLRRPKNYSGHKWTTRDGTVIPIEDMTDSHIDNAIRHMERTADRMAERAERGFMYIVGMEPGDDPCMDWWPQGEMAQDLFESQMWAADFDSEPVYHRSDFLRSMKMYRVLMDEQRRRQEGRRGFRAR